MLIRSYFESLVTLCGSNCGQTCFFMYLDLNIWLFGVKLCSIDRQSCDKPDSVKFLLEIDKTTKDKTRKPVKPVYKNIRASLKREIAKA